MLNLLQGNWSQVLDTIGDANDETVDLHNQATWI